MATAPFIEAFKLLSTNDARHTALDALVRELTPHEWRRLHSMTSARSFQCDIIGQLPVELVAHVFSYLDTTTPYRLQLVSTRWAHLLRSLDVLKPSLDQWYAGTVDLHSADYALCEQKARRVHSFRNGKPSTIFKVKLRRTVQRLSLAGDTLIWDLKPDFHDRLRSIYLLDLAAWEIRTVSADAREEICTWVASDQIVALATFPNVFYISTLQGQGRKTFKVPSHAYFSTLACRGRTVACAASFDDCMSVCIWDYDTQQARSCQIAHHPWHLRSGPGIKHRQNQPLALLLQPDTKTFLVFGDDEFLKPFDDLSGTTPGQIIYNRYTYDGVCISSSHIPPLNELTTVIHRPGRPLVPVDQNGQFALRTVFKMREGEWLPVRLRFDERLNKFTNINDPASEDSLWIGDLTAWWKDTFYGVPPFIEDSPTQVMLAHMGTSGMPNLKPFVFERTDPRSNDYWDIIDVTLAMNENYVIRKAGSTVYLLSFDNSDKHPKQDGSFFNIGDVEVAPSGVEGSSGPSIGRDVHEPKMNNT